jgi:ribonuclease BN (tRNA processing enzyme)
LVRRLAAQREVKPSFERAAANGGATRSWRHSLDARRVPRTARTTDKLVLLGTAGGSNPKATRSGVSNAVFVNGAAYLVDCGEGANTQLFRAGGVTHRPPGRTDVALLRSVFITHLHSDHLIDYVNLFLGTWPHQRIDVFGPAPAGLPVPHYPPSEPAPPLLFPDDPTPGMRATTEYLLRAFAYNLNVRIADEGRPDITKHIRVHEIGHRRDGYEPAIDLGVSGNGSSAGAASPTMEPVVVYPTDDNGVTVSAVLVQHAPVFPAFAYRFDTPNGSIVFSGDTGACENLVRLARGADYLVHEVIDLEWIGARLRHLPNAEAVLNHLSIAHSTAEGVGRAATAAGVGTLVLTHLVPGDDELTVDEWEQRVRPHFGGNVVCGVDLDEFELA